MCFFPTFSCLLRSPISLLLNHHWLVAGSQPVLPTLSAVRVTLGRRLNSRLARCSLRRQDTGEVVYEQGDSADNVLVLLRGRASLAVQRKGKSIIVRQLGPGCVSGGMSCFVGIPHRGTVRVPLAVAMGERGW